MIDRPDWDNQFAESEDERNTRLRARRLDAQKLTCPGIGRDKDNSKAMQFYFSRPVTDDEMRFLHEVVQRAVACMPSAERLQS